MHRAAADEEGEALWEDVARVDHLPMEPFISRAVSGGAICFQGGQRSYSFLWR